MTLVERITAIRKRYESKEIAQTYPEDEDSVWCGETDELGYLGWCKRSYAEAKGYEIIWTDEDAELLAVLDDCLVLAEKEAA